MRYRAEDYIRPDIMHAARSAGLKAPIWAAGCGSPPKDIELDKTLDDWAREAAERQRGLGSIGLEGAVEPLLDDDFLNS